MGLLETIIGFVLMGITLEVFWTSIFNYKKTKNPRLIGHTYLWMFLIYSVVPFIYIFVLNNLNSSIYLRSIIYMVSFYLLEFIFWYLIRKFVGVSPWDYSNYFIKIFGKKYKSNFLGLVCVEYAPIWYLYGVVGELYFLFLINL